MIGDGLNDAPVLAQADVSMAVGSSVPLAQAQADVVLPTAALGLILVLREQARRSMRIVRQNLVWAAAYNAVCVPLALTGWLPAWAAGLGMALSSLWVVLNAARLSRPPAMPAPSRA
jgi:Cu2+-exporting ATPase